MTHDPLGAMPRGAGEALSDYARTWATRTWERGTDRPIIVT